MPKSKSTTIIYRFKGVKMKFFNLKTHKGPLYIQWECDGWRPALQVNPNELKQWEIRLVPKCRKNAKAGTGVFRWLRKR